MSVAQKPSMGVADPLERLRGTRETAPAGEVRVRVGPDAFAEAARALREAGARFATLFVAERPERLLDGRVRAARRARAAAYAGDARIGGPRARIRARACAARRANSNRREPVAGFDRHRGASSRRREPVAGVDRRLVARGALGRAGARRAARRALGRRGLRTAADRARRRQARTARAGPRRVRDPLRAGALGDLRGDPVSDRDRRRGRARAADAAVLQAPRDGGALRRARAGRRGGRRRTRRRDRELRVCERVLAGGRARARRGGAEARGVLARGPLRARADGLPPGRDRQGGRDHRSVCRAGALSDPQGADHAPARPLDWQPLRARDDRAGRCAGGRRDRSRRAAGRAR